MEPSGTSPIATYLLFTLALVVTPGSTTAVVVRNTLAGGRLGGIATAAGAAVANASHAAAAGLGLAFVLARWPPALGAVRAAGGLYLAWLGGVSLWRAIRHADGGLALPDGTGSAPDGRRHFTQGLTVNLLSPAIITFYLVVVPSFVPQGAPPWYFAAMAAAHVVMAFGCHGTWTLAFARLRRVFRAPLARRTLEAVSGIALAGLALKVLFGNLSQ